MSAPRAPFVALLLAGLASCESPSAPGDVTCFVDPALSPAMADAVLLGTSRWSQETFGYFACARIVHEPHNGSLPNSITFQPSGERLPPNDDGSPRLAWTWRADGEIRSVVTLAADADEPTISHEVGHALGLKDVASGAQSVMFPPSQRTPAPTATDAEAFAELWEKRAP